MNLPVQRLFYVRAHVKSKALAGPIMRWSLDRFWHPLNALALPADAYFLTLRGRSGVELREALEQLEQHGHSVEFRAVR